MCATNEVKSQVVDLVMHRTLDEINLEEETLDELLIRIPNCRHVFTVETLDGLCHMNDYYSTDGVSGKWLGLQAPPDGFQKPPVCPTCRASITSPRYGRIFKRADLDILELNTMGRMLRALDNVCGSWQSFSKEEAEKILTAANVDPGRISSSPKEQKSRIKARAKATNKDRRITAVSVQSINPGNKEFHSVSPAVAAVWRTATKELMESYRRACDIAATRSAHVNAWDAAFSCLYNQEMERSLSDPRHAPRRPEEHAMRVARMSVGQPQPRADKRYAVEAIWATLEIRLTLAQLARTWLKVECETRKSYPIEHRQSWGSYTTFLFATCAADAQIAFDIAKDSDSRRQMTITSLLLWRIGLERFSFNVELLQHCNRMIEERANLMTTTSAKIADTKKEMVAVLKDHLAIKRSAEKLAEEEIWLTSNFTSKAITLLTEWQKLERALRSQTFYQPVSLEEQMAIVKSFKFCEFQAPGGFLGLTGHTAHTGHFYNCPNGHTYVIEDVRSSFWCGR